MKAGTVALIGRPNAGKSTLLNRLIGQKIAIVSDKPQTTRHRILGVRHTEAGQIAFIDTPGIHKPVHAMNRRMVETAYDALDEANAIVVVVDATARLGAGDEFVLTRVRRIERPLIAALNKIDLVHKPRLLPLLGQLATMARFEALVPVSAQTGDGLDRLEAELLRVLPEGEPIYPADVFTNQTERGLAAETIREQLLRLTRDELPYATAIVVDRYDDPVPPERLTRIFASILVDAESQKAIVIGRAGTMIRRIGMDARRALETLLDGPVHLELHVKVREGWRDDERQLRDIRLPGED